jgi:hypothetical protein
MHMVRFAEALNTHESQAEPWRGPWRKPASSWNAPIPAAIPAAAMRELSSKQNLQTVLKGTQSPQLRAFLLRGNGDLPRAELTELRLQLAQEGKRRRELFLEAKRRFGVDGGVFAKDDHTLVVELLAPTPIFCSLLPSTPAFPCRAGWSTPKAQVGAGSYREESSATEPSTWRRGGWVIASASSAATAIGIEPT